MLQRMAIENRPYDSSDDDHSHEMNLESTVNTSVTREQLHLSNTDVTTPNIENIIDISNIPEPENQPQPKVFVVKARSRPKNPPPPPPKKRRVWKDDHVASLLGILRDYKTCCDFKGMEFESDKPQLLENVRSSMAKLYPPTDFGHKSVVDGDHAGKAQILKGKSSVKDKIKTTRAIYRDSLKHNTRSGAGKVITDNWDTLDVFWEGSPAVTSLPFGQGSSQINEDFSETDDPEDNTEYFLNEYDLNRGDVICAQDVATGPEKSVKTFVDNKRNKK